MTEQSRFKQLLDSEGLSISGGRNITWGVPLHCQHERRIEPLMLVLFGTPGGQCRLAQCLCIAWWTVALRWFPPMQPDPAQSSAFQSVGTATICL